MTILNRMMQNLNSFESAFLWRLRILGNFMFILLKGYIKDYLSIYWLNFLLRRQGSLYIRNLEYISNSWQQFSFILRDISSLCLLFPYWHTQFLIWCNLTFKFCFCFQRYWKFRKLLSVSLSWSVSSSSFQLSGISNGLWQISS